METTGLHIGEMVSLKHQNIDGTTDHIYLECVKNENNMCSGCYINRREWCVHH